MNGVHDMGGLTCFGRIPQEDDEPVFHADWETRVLALSVAAASLFGPIDRRRHALERLDPVTYLGTSYYERWLTRLELQTVEDGWLTEAELQSGAIEKSSRVVPVIAPEDIEAVVKAGRPATRESGRIEPRFVTGDRVRARNLQPSGHTRLARYVRGRIGVIARLHGTHCFPDTNAHGQGENPQPLYSVQFSAAELWGPAAPERDRLFIDLWEDYLEPLESGDSE